MDYFLLGFGAYVFISYAYILGTLFEGKKSIDGIDFLFGVASPVIFPFVVRIDIKDYFFRKREENAIKYSCDIKEDFNGKNRMS